MKPIIKVKSLSKQYRIGPRLTSYTTLREKLAEIIESPLKRVLNGKRSQVTATVWALKDVSFEVHPGEVVGIVGRNGSGKSTLLKTLSNITQPTAGSVELYGRCGSLLEVGTGFHPELTGRENVFLNGAILGMSRAEIRQHFDEIVAFAEVDEFMDTPVKHYSSGMYLRLAFAVAAHLRTEILFIDEVLAVGDTEFQRKCLGKVEGLAREGRTVLFVSHNMGAVAQLCGRALWLNEGRLESCGNSHDIVSAYLSSAYTGKHSWERAHDASPSQRDICLCSVRLYQGGRESNGVVSFNEEFTVEIAYEVKKVVADVSMVLRITSETGTIVFSSSDTDTVSDHQGQQSDPRGPGVESCRSRQEGRYVSACKIPGRLLKSGNFFLAVGARRRQGTWIEFQENVLIFAVSAVGNPVHARHHGVITPILDWSVKKVEI
jgi:lipopolysaccharide transport system ATP-binding protein